MVGLKKHILLEDSLCSVIIRVIGVGQTIAQKVFKRGVSG